MKRKLFGIAGALAALLALMVLAGCDNGTTNSTPDANFVGTWTGTATLGGQSASATVTVTDSGWNFSCSAAGMYESGIYTVNANTATLKTVDGHTVGTATLSGSTLTVRITSGSYAGGSGTFTKSSGGGNPTPTLCTITYSVGTGSGIPPSSRSVEPGQIIILPGQGSMTAPVGWTFSGWKDDYYGIVSKAGATYTVNRNTVFTAQWEEWDDPLPSVFYSVTYSVGTGSGIPPSSQSVEEGQTITLPGQGNMTAPAGQTFNGWRDDYYGTVYKAGDAYTVNRYTVFTAQWKEEKNGVYIGLISFAGDVTDLNNYNSLYYLDSSGRSSLQSSLSRYTKASQPGTALFYAVHKALANLKAAESTLPTDIHSVNLITFTDGLDNASFGTSTNNPIDGKSGVDSTDYAAYIKEQIGSRTVGGKPINAYSIGVKGSDVTDEAQFNANLSNIASLPANVLSLTNFSELQDALTQIANGIDVNVDRKTNFTMQTTQNNPGTVVRMTFDVTGTSPADAASASRYIDGTLDYNTSTKEWSLINIQYSAGITSDSDVTIIGTASGSIVSFTFNNIIGHKPQSGIYTPKQWFKSSGSASWQINSEYSASGATNTTVNVDTSLIYLVLDASTSLGNDEISTIRGAVNSFITTLYNRTHPSDTSY